MTIATVAGEADEIAAKGPLIGKIIEGPVTGWPVLDFGPDAPILTCEDVRAMLVDFP